VRENIKGAARNGQALSRPFHVLSTLSPLQAESNRALDPLEETSVHRDQPLHFSRKRSLSPTIGLALTHNPSWMRWP